MRAALVGFLVVLGGCALGPQPTGPMTAKVESGLVRGAASAGIATFKGIPYAAPPVGALRWRPPQPPAKWDGIRDAAEYGAICMQKYPTTDNGVGRQAPSEDCLTLNVWTSRLDSRAKLPVMVWIHGGGFVNGSGTADLYDGAQLAKRGVVVVTINYRLGRLGAFAHPALTQEAAGGPVANYGLMDMIASLKWVKRNVGAFGGDSTNVTIFGESAGGAAVNRLMISPAAQGLFAKAVVESGAGREPLLNLHSTSASGRPSAESDGEAFARSLGIAAADVSALRAIPADKIIAAGDPNMFAGGGPILDGDLFPMSVEEAFAHGLEAKIPYIVGFNSAELPFSTAGIDGALTQLAPLFSSERQALLPNYGDEDTFAALVVGDVVFSEPARRLASLHARNGQPAYLYRFSVVSSSVRGRSKGTRHAQERQYVFDTLATSPYVADDNDEIQAQTVGAYWTTFAKRGDPNQTGRPLWPRYSADKDELLEFTNDGPVPRKTPFAERLKALARRYPGE